MATAVESNQRYYCHRCEQTISPTIPDYLCPTCNLGFIEEMNGDEDMEIDDDDNEQLPNIREEALLQNNMFRRHFDFGGRPSRRRRLHVRTTRPSNSHADLFGHLAAIDQILQLFSYDGQVPQESALPGNRPLNLFHIHGNPGDYAWGGRGLDSIITRLLEQMEGSGPPPAEADKIAGLQTTKIVQSDIDSHLECPVCKEAFELDEEVKELPCKHYFHETCITPWLEKHDSCPICRLGLNGSPSGAK